MTKRLAVLTLSLLALGGCATKADLDATNAKVVSLQNQVMTLNARLDAPAPQAHVAPKPIRGCLLGGQLYSPGAVYAGRICEDTRMMRRAGESEEWAWRLRTTNR